MTTPSKSGSGNSHARLAPSASSRWMVCTASIAYEIEHQERVFEQQVRNVIALTPYLVSIPDEVTAEESRAVRWARDVSHGRVLPKNLTDEQKRDIRKADGNIYSREGTRAHDFASDILKGKKTLNDIPEEFRIHVGAYVEHCLGLIEPGDVPYIEEPIPPFYSPQETSTVDFGIVRETRIIIRDLKYGAGELVEPENNTQLGTYALSFVALLEKDGLYSFDPDTEIDIGIFQPRHHAGAAARNWIVSLADLREFGKEIQAKHDLIMEGNEIEFSPSFDTCRYCPCKMFCAKRGEDAAGALNGPDTSGIDLLADLPEIDDLDGVSSQRAFNKLPVDQKIVKRLEPLDMAYDLQQVLDDETLVRLRNKTKAITDWLGDIKEHLDGRVLGGEKIEGLKIVMGREGDRAWGDEEAADKLLSGKLKADERYTRKLVTPTQAEKILDLEKQSTRFQNSFKKLVTRSAARKSVASEDDDRPAVKSDIDDLPEIAGEEEFDYPEGM